MVQGDVPQSFVITVSTGALAPGASTEQVGRDLENVVDGGR